MQINTSEFTNRYTIRVNKQMSPRIFITEEVIKKGCQKSGSNVVIVQTDLTRMQCMGGSKIHPP